MAWIESHQELRNHPKLTDARQKLAAEIRTNPSERAQLIGHLHLLWWWCMDYALDGDLTRYTIQQIAEAAEWPGDPHHFVEALASAGFLDGRSGGVTGKRYLVHDWLDFCGELIRKRLRRKDEKRQKTADIVRRNPPKCRLPYRTVPNQPNHINTVITREKFIKPTAQEVTAYARTIGFKLDGEAFLAYYESRGWKLRAGVPVKDWKSCVITWKKNAPLHALILPERQKPAEKPIPKEDLVSHEDLKGLLSNLRREVPHV